VYNFCYISYDFSNNNDNETKIRMNLKENSWYSSEQFFSIFIQDICCVIELKYSNKMSMYSVKHNNVYYSISDNKFWSFRPSAGQRYTNFKKTGYM